MLKCSSVTRLIAVILIILSLFPLPASAQTSTTVPPARTYYQDSEGRRMGVKERWSEDANGERNGAYMLYNEQGYVVESSTFVHGVQTGAGRSYRYYVNRSLVALLEKASGNYVNGQRSGTWTSTDSKGALSKTEVYRNGKLTTTTFYDKGRPVNIEQYGPITASAATVAGTSPNSFYYYLPAQREQFLVQKYYVHDRETAVTGAELLKPEYREYLTSGILLARLVHDCREGYQMILLLKQVKSMGGNPLKAIMQESVWDCYSDVGCYLDYTNSINNYQVIAELLYYGLVAPDDYVHPNSNLKLLLLGCKDLHITQKEQIQVHFAACALANHDPHADPSRYPLRFWLGKKFADSNQSKYMNTITKPDPVRDPQWFP